MNEWLAQYFGTAPVADETEKQASADLFVKLAQENGIDLNAMSDAEVQELYESTMGKVAEKESKKEEDKEKVEEAKKEHEEKKEGAAKFAEAVFMGQTMAHAFSAELDKIAETKEAISGAEVGARLRNLGSQAKGVAKKVGDIATGGEFRRGHALSKKVQSGDVGRKVEDVLYGHGVGHGHPRFEEAKKMMIEDAAEKAKHHMRAGAAKTLGLYGGGAALAAGGAAAAHHEKKSSALDELAAEMVVQKVASVGWNADEAANRIAAILTLGVSDENSKVAFTQTVEEAIEVRSLELAEAAGYPVTWPTE